MGTDFEVEQAEQGSGSVPLLALWRTYLPHEVDHADAERLHGTLLARCRVALAVEERREWTHQYAVLVDAAEMRDPMAWCELAGCIEHLFACLDTQLAGDLKGSCLWLAARGRSRWANWMLIGALIEAESALTAEAHLDMIGHLCRCLPNLGTLPEQFMRRVGVEERLKQLWLPPRPAPQADAESEEEEGIEAPPMNGMVVLGAMPPMPTGRDDLALVKRYAVLAEPVLLASVPDADVVAAELLAQFPWMANAIDAVRIELALARHCGVRSLRLATRRNMR